MSGVQLAGAYNFRDLGGLPTDDGRRTRPQRLFRSDTLQELTAQDVELLWTSFGVRFVLDLRSADEAASEGRGLLTRFPICYANVPLTEGGPLDDATENHLTTLYRHFLDNDVNLSVAINVAATAVIRDPVVLHCAAGKDRTGVVGALLLRVIGVTEEAVVNDYMASGANMGRVIERFRRLPRYSGKMDVYPPEVYQCNESAIRSLLHVVDREHGSAREWAIGRGLSAVTIERMQHALLEPA